MGFREAALPNFPPTYKTAAESEIKEGAWKSCRFGGELGKRRCYHNKDKKGKHNPAWTDRILIKEASKYYRLETAEYSQRPVDSSFGTDHNAVTARVTLRYDLHR